MLYYIDIKAELPEAPTVRGWRPPLGPGGNAGNPARAGGPGYGGGDLCGSAPAHSRFRRLFFPQFAHFFPLISCYKISSTPDVKTPSWSPGAKVRRPGLPFQIF